MFPEIGRPENCVSAACILKHIVDMELGSSEECGILPPELSYLDMFTVVVDDPSSADWVVAAANVGHDELGFYRVRHIVTVREGDPALCDHRPDENMEMEWGVPIIEAMARYGTKTHVIQNRQILWDKVADYVERIPRHR